MWCCSTLYHLNDPGWTLSCFMAVAMLSLPLYFLISVILFLSAFLLSHFLLFLILFVLLPPSFTYFCSFFYSHWKSVVCTVIFCTYLLPRFLIMCWGCMYTILVWHGLLYCSFHCNLLYFFFDIFSSLLQSCTFCGKAFVLMFFKQCIVLVGVSKYLSFNRVWKMESYKECITV